MAPVFVSSTPICGINCETIGENTLFWSKKHKGVPLSFFFGHDFCMRLKHSNDGPLLVSPTTICCLNDQKIGKNIFTFFKKTQRGTTYVFFQAFFYKIEIFFFFFLRLFFLHFLLNMDRRDREETGEREGRDLR